MALVPNHLEKSAAGYRVATTLFGISAVVNLVGVALAALTAPMRALSAVAYCHFLVMILSLKALGNAADNDTLDSDTYRRLNLALAGSAAAGLATAAFHTATLSSVKLAQVAAFGTVTLSSLIAMFVALSAFGNSVQEHPAAAVLKGAGATALEMVKPASLAGFVYRIFTVFLVGEAVVALANPALITEALGANMLSLPGAAAAARSWGAGAVLQAGAAFTLASAADRARWVLAADRARLTGTTFKDLNLGFVVGMTFKAVLLGQVVWRATQVAVVPQAGFAYVGACWAMALFCAIQHGPPKTKAALAPLAAASSSSSSAPAAATPAAAPAASAPTPSGSYATKLRLVDTLPRAKVEAREVNKRQWGIGAQEEQAKSSTTGSGEPSEEVRGEAKPEPKASTYSTQAYAPPTAVSGASDEAMSDAKSAEESGGAVADYLASLDKVSKRGTNTLQRRAKEDIFSE